MNAPIKHTAVWQGKEHELSLSGWARLTDKSRTFLTKCMDRAAIDGIAHDKLMQWAIEQTPCDPKISGSHRKTNGIRPQNAETARRKREESNEGRINKLLLSFAGTNKVSAEKESTNTENQVVKRGISCYLV